ncbi:unnamed protein product [Auanema sp. JU1783]|nr:unnamed protein product [Auanema sp. JU1783]
MGKGFQNFMSKKDFHPSAWWNLKRVWEAKELKAQKEKKEEEMRVQYQKEQEMLNNKALLGDEKAKLGLSFMYDPPAGMTKREEPKEEPKFEWQRKYQAPREEYAKNNELIQDQPFGIQVRNVRCCKCHKYGHVNTDKECPLYGMSGNYDDPGYANNPSDLFKELRKGPMPAPSRPTENSDDEWTEKTQLAEDMEESHGLKLKGKLLKEMQEVDQLKNMKGPVKTKEDMVKDYVQNLSADERKKLDKKIREFITGKTGDKKDKSKKKKKQKKEKKEKKRKRMDSSSSDDSDHDHKSTRKEKRRKRMDSSSSDDSEQDRKVSQKEKRRKRMDSTDSEDSVKDHKDSRNEKRRKRADSSSSDDSVEDRKDSRDGRKRKRSVSSDSDDSVKDRKSSRDDRKGSKHDHVHDRKSKDSTSERDRNRDRDRDRDRSHASGRDREREHDHSRRSARDRDRKATHDDHRSSRSEGYHAKKRRGSDSHSGNDHRDSRDDRRSTRHENSHSRRRSRSP